MVVKKNSNLIKAANQALVIDVLRQFQTVSVEDIIHLTRLSRQTVLTIISSLQEKRLIEKSGYKTQSVGRRPTLYSLSTTSHFAMGIDVDIPSIYLDISTLDGTLYYSRKWQVPAEVNGDQVVESLIRNIRKAMEETQLSADKIIGLGLGLPGIVDFSNNTADKISRVRGWKREKHGIIADIIEEEFGVKTYVRNDAHLLSLLEISPSASDFLFVLYRSGIGMAPVIDGAIYEGKFGNAGYIGHTRMGFRGNICDCGSKDCMETYCSKRTIESEYYVRTGSSCSYDQLVALADQGDQTAADIFREAGFYLGIGIANSMKSLDIPTVFIGDMRCSENHVFFKSTVDSIKENLSNFSVSSIEVKLADAMGEHYGMGGCYYVLNQFFSEPKLLTNFSDLGGGLIEEAIQHRG